MDELNELINFEKFKSVVEENFDGERYLTRFFIQEWKLFEHPVIVCCVTDKKFPLVVSHDMLVTADYVAYITGAYVYCRNKRYSCDLIFRLSVL